MSDVIYGLVSSEKVNKRVTVFSSGDEMLPCANCGTEVRFTSKLNGEKLHAVVCGNTCLFKMSANWFPAVPVSEIIPESPRDPTMEDSESNLSVDNVKPENKATKEVKRFTSAVCPECSGPRQGRGYHHSESCSKLVKKVEMEVKPPCSECGGPARGRGHTHDEGCSMKAVKVVHRKSRRPVGAIA